MNQVAADAFELYDTAGNGTLDHRELLLVLADVGALGDCDNKAMASHFGRVFVELAPANGLVSCSGGQLGYLGSLGHRWVRGHSSQGMALACALPPPARAAHSARARGCDQTSQSFWAGSPGSRRTRGVASISESCLCSKGNEMKIIGLSTEATRCALCRLTR